MKAKVLRFFFIHLAVLAVTAVGSALVGGWPFGLSALAGGASFSIPVVAFSTMVLGAVAGDQRQFWGRFLLAEMLKWASASGLLTLAFVVGWFDAVALLVGFLIAVVASTLISTMANKVLWISAPKESES